MSVDERQYWPYECMLVSCTGVLSYPLCGVCRELALVLLYLMVEGGGLGVAYRVGRVYTLKQDVFVSYTCPLQYDELGAV